MFSRLFNRGKHEEKNEPHGVVSNGFAFLGADMHSHFIPGIDDGAKTIEDSITLIRMLTEMGYTTAITTPHVMIDYYPNTTEIITEGLKNVQAAVAESNLNITIKAAAEYYIDEYFTALIDKEPLLTVHDNHVLVECSMMYEPPMLTDVLFKMMSAGYRPILAHPERYPFFHGKNDKYSELKDRGCLFQLNALAVTGYYGKMIKDAADNMLSLGMYDYLGTDMHHEKHAEALNNLTASKYYQSLISYPFLNNKLCL